MKYGGDRGFDIMCLVLDIQNVEGPLRPKGKYTIGHANLGLKLGWNQEPVWPLLGG